MQRINATRTALLGVRAKTRNAIWGCEILKEKRNSLLREFMKTVPAVLRESEALDQSMSRAYQALTQMIALDGPEKSGSCAMASRGEFLISMEQSNVMGVAIPKIEAPSPVRAPTSRGYHLLGTSLQIDAAARDFEAVLQRLIELASVEIRLKALGEEVKKTNRIVNSLEQVVIPELRTQARYIQLVLDEREREDTFRLRRMKQMLKRKSKIKESSYGGK